MRLAANELSMRCSGWNVADSQKPFIDLIDRDEVLDITVQRKFHNFEWAGSVVVLFQPC